MFHFRDCGIWMGAGEHVSFQYIHLSKNNCIMHDNQYVLNKILCIVTKRKRNFIYIMIIEFNFSHAREIIYACATSCTCTIGSLSLDYLFHKSHRIHIKKLIKVKLYSNVFENVHYFIFVLCILTLIILSPCCTPALAAAPSKNKIFNLFI